MPSAFNVSTRNTEVPQGKKEIASQALDFAAITAFAVFAGAITGFATIAACAGIAAATTFAAITAFAVFAGAITGFTTVATCTGIAATARADIATTGAAGSRRLASGAGGHLTGFNFRATIARVLAVTSINGKGNAD